MIRVHNLRAGFATNSSSSHSVVILPDDLVGKVWDQDIDGGLNFGWERFVLASPEAKMRYLLAQLLTATARYDNTTYERVTTPEHERFYERFAQEIGEIGREEDFGIDHQSLMAVPMGTDQTSLDALIRYFKSPKIVILGGNDNSDPFQPFDGVTPDPLGSALLTGDRGGRVKMDKGHFILFSQENGNKVRISFDDTSEAYLKSTTPELVDLKITDYCAKGCRFCYQSSTTKGVHAPFETITKTVDMLAKMGVFEIAIGGGEPTTHPRFQDIMIYIRAAGIVPNFTTLNDALPDNPGLMSAAEMAGGIGVSCLSAKDLELVRRIGKNFNRWSGPKVMAQHVLGAVPLDVTGEFLSQAFAARIPVLLLGYKEVGFGKNHVRHDSGEVATFLKLAVARQDGVALSVDTALVDRFPDLPAALGAPKALVSSPEGKFSCYIDAVTGKMAASSYVEPETMDDLVLDVDAFEALYARY